MNEYLVITTLLITIGVALACLFVATVAVLIAGKAMSCVNDLEHLLGTLEDDLNHTQDDVHELMVFLNLCEESTEKSEPEFFDMPDYVDKLVAAAGCENAAVENDVAKDSTPGQPVKFPGIYEDANGDQIYVIQRLYGSVWMYVYRSQPFKVKYDFPPVTKALLTHHTDLSMTSTDEVFKNV